MVDKLKWTNDRRTLRDLLPRERNPRRIAQPEAERLVDSYEKFDQAEVILIGPENQLYNGHQRLKVWAEQYGPDLEVDVRVASRALTDPEWQKLTVYLHRGTTGEWDFDMLLDDFELDDLLDWGFKPIELNLRSEESTIDLGEKKEVGGFAQGQQFVEKDKVSFILTFDKDDADMRARVLSFCEEWGVSYTTKLS